MSAMIARLAISTICLTLSLALLPPLARALSILADESPWLLVPFAVVTVAYVVWQWTLTLVVADVSRKPVRAVSTWVKSFFK